MTTQDNQQVAILITVTSRTASGADWEGSVELSGPFDDNMVDQAVSMSKELTEKALCQENVSVEECVKAAPSRPSKHRKLAAAESLDIDAVEANALFDANVAAGQIGSPQTLGQPEDTQQNDLPFDALPF